jgi:hypothetical protein
MHEAALDHAQLQRVDRGRHVAIPSPLPLGIVRRSRKACAFGSCRECARLAKMALDRSGPITAQHTETNCVAGVVGLEPPNPDTSYLFEISCTTLCLLGNAW